MKTLFLDCGMGAAGDMLTAALLELHPDPADFLRRLNAALPEEVRVSAAPLCQAAMRAAPSSPYRSSQRRTRASG